MIAYDFVPSWSDDYDMTMHQVLCKAYGTVV